MVKAYQAAGGAGGMPESADEAESASNGLENQLAREDDLEAKQYESDGTAKQKEAESMVSPIAMK
eukprot:9854051-Alexandrium_andersonii.AAC.1